LLPVLFYTFSGGETLNRNMCEMMHSTAFLTPEKAKKRTFLG
jgi:hypothetical protein